MDRKRIAVVAGTIVGTLAIATAAGAANFGLLRSADEDPVPAVGNLDAGDSTSSSSAAGSTSSSIDDATTSTASTSPTTPGTTPTSVEDHGTGGGDRTDDSNQGPDRGGSDGTVSDDGPDTSVGTVPDAAPVSRPITVITTDDHGGDRSGTNRGSDDGSGSSGHGGSGSSTSGDDHPDDD